MSDNNGELIEGKGAPPPRWILKSMTKTHVFLNRLVGGRYFNTLQGDEVCFVKMTGAKSGRTITIPLMYVPYRDGVILVASLDEKAGLWPICDENYAPFEEYRERTTREIPMFVCEGRD
jgi:hypothetical protein